jgi:hypothetical protein
VRALLANQGYTEVNDVEFKEGVWTADGKSADGNHVEVKVDNTGKVDPGRQRRDHHQGPDHHQGAGSRLQERP